MAKIKTVVSIDPIKRKAKHTAQGNGGSANTVPKGKRRKQQFKRYRGQGR